MSYIVRENDCGYMPDSDPAEFDTLAEAKDYARSLKNEWYDMQWDTPKSERDHISVDNPLKTITRALAKYGIVYARLEKTIDRVIVITYNEFDI